MTHKPLTLWKTRIAALAILLTLGCSFFSGGPQPTPPPLPTTVPTQIQVQPATKQVHPTPEPPEPGVEPLQVDYLYTSNLITIIYPLYGSLLDDFAITYITNTRSTDAQVVVMSEITGYTEQSIDTVYVGAGESVEVRQNPLLIPSVIDELNVEKPAQFHLKVTELYNGEEKLLLEETGDTLIYARRDFPWSIPGFTDAEVYELTAAMVTPNDPSVEELIRYAADYTDSGIMWSGYGGHIDDDDGGVWDRLQAIWQAEEDVYDLTYISTWVSFAPGSVQRIRLPAEVLDQRSGNCIELALLYASAAEALDLETAIILIPGHAYMGVRTDQENANYYFIETTMIGRATFSEAVDRGSEEFDEALPSLDAGEESYGWVNIWEAREKGILPLPWR
jgi:hypothetical protein